MNIRTYITLGIIGISASGIQGTNFYERYVMLATLAYCGVKTWQRAQNSDSILHAPMLQLTQKLHTYRYPIGGAMVLAGLLYGGYYALKQASHSTQNSTSTNINTMNNRLSIEDLMENPYRFDYEVTVCTPPLTPPIIARTECPMKLQHTARVKDIFYNGKLLSAKEIQAVPWSAGYAKRAIDDFVRNSIFKKIRKRNCDIRVSYGHHSINLTMHKYDALDNEALTNFYHLQNVDTVAKSLAKCFMNKVTHL